MNENQHALQQPKPELSSPGAPKVDKPLDRRAAFCALVRFADHMKGTWPRGAATPQYQEALQKHVVPQKLRRARRYGNVDPTLLDHDGHSLVQYVRDLMRAHASRGDRTLQRFFREGSSCIKSESLAKFGYQTVATVPVQQPKRSRRRPRETSTLGPAASELGINYSWREETGSGAQFKIPKTAPEIPAGSIAFGQTSRMPTPPVQGSHTETAGTVHTGGRSQNQPAQETVVQPPNAAQQLQGAAQQPSNSRSSLVTVSNRSQPARSQDSRAQSERPVLPCIDSFLLDNRQIQAEVGAIFSSIERAARQEFETAGIALDAPADFELKPSVDLQKIYETALGTRCWKDLLSTRPASQQPRAFDTLLAIVGAMVHAWVLEKAQPWQGALKEDFGSPFHLRHVRNTISKYTGQDLEKLLHLAARDEVLDTGYAQAVLQPQASTLATDAAVVLSQHLSRLSCSALPNGPIPFRGRWKAEMNQIFCRALHLAAKFGVSKGAFTFKWYAAGARFSAPAMEGRYHTGIGDSVRLCLFPGVELHPPGVGTIFASKAVVIASVVDQIA